MRREKRRRRKRGLFPDPPKRAFINELVCEGCGDCGVKSNCVAIAPSETDFGRKRQIDQSVCNKDFSCVNGFCPSFVTVHGGELRKGRRQRQGREGGGLRSAAGACVAPLSQPYGILITGIGGTGVVTIGALLGMAAHLEGKGAGIIDMAGLSQKNGSVVTHMKIAARPDDIQTIRVSAGAADLVLGCDLVTTGSEKNLAPLGRTHPAGGQFARKPCRPISPAMQTTACRQNDCGSASRRAPTQECRLRAGHAAGHGAARRFHRRQSVPGRLCLPEGPAAGLGRSDRAGHRTQCGFGEMNKKAFLWGRRAAHDMAAVEAVVAPRSGEDDDAGRT